MGDAPDPLPPPREPPLSAKDLSDVHALLDATETPLRGKRVMVPMTSQAFFEGTLLPGTSASVDGEGSAEKTQSLSDGRRDDTTAEELVIANLGQGNLAEMPRAQAADFVKRRIDAIVGATEQRTGSASVKAARSSAGDGKKGSTQPVESSPTVLPFFEIREEFDAQGREINAEAVNVAEQMKALKDAVKASSENIKVDGAKGTTKREGVQQLMEVLDIDEELNGGETQMEGGESRRTTELDEEEQAQPISDEKYEAVSTRLDELIRLEEEAERNKSVGATKSSGSKKKVQSKGWAKGFLNADPGKKKKGKKPTAKAKVSNNAAAPSTAAPVSSETRNEPEHKKQVGFRAENDVREIPRIGRTSVNSTIRAQPRGGGAAAAPNPTHGAAPVPWERGPFTGVIKERPIGGSIVGDQRPVTSMAQPADQPKKKLSRFAQQRLQQKG